MCYFSCKNMIPLVVNSLCFFFFFGLIALALGGFPCSSVGKESTCNAGDPGLIPGLGRSTGEGIGYPLQYLGFPCGSTGKKSACSVGDLRLIPGLGRSPGEGKGYPLQYCDLENSMDCIVHGVTKSQTCLSNSHFSPYIEGSSKYSKLQWKYI